MNRFLQDRLLTILQDRLVWDGVVEDRVVKDRIMKNRLGLLSPVAL